MTRWLFPCNRSQPGSPPEDLSHDLTGSNFQHLPDPTHQLCSLLASCRFIHMEGRSGFCSLWAPATSDIHPLISRQNLRLIPSADSSCQLLVFQHLPHSALNTEDCTGFKGRKQVHWGEMLASLDHRKAWILTKAQSYFAPKCSLVGSKWGWSKFWKFSPL